MHLFDISATISWYATFSGLHSFQCLHVLPKRDFPETTQRPLKSNKMIDSVENIKNVWPHVWCPVSPPTLSLGPAVLFQSFLGVPDYFCQCRLKLPKPNQWKNKNRKLVKIGSGSAVRPDPNLTRRYIRCWRSSGSNFPPPLQYVTTTHINLDVSCHYSIYIYIYIVENEAKFHKKGQKKWKTCCHGPLHGFEIGKPSSM